MVEFRFKCEFPAFVEILFYHTINTLSVLTGVFDDRYIIV